MSDGYLLRSIACASALLPVLKMRFGGCGLDIEATFAVSMELGRG